MAYREYLDDFLYKAIVEKRLESSKLIARGENPCIQVHSLKQFPLAVVFEEYYKEREAGRVHISISTTVIGRDEDFETLERKYRKNKI